jgi:uncharacterized protein (TIRG00374 family)
LAKKIKAFLKFFIFFALGGLILYLLYRSQDRAFAEQCLIDGIASEDCNYFQKLWTDFKSVKIGWLLLVIAMYLASNLSRAARWMLMFKPMGYTIRFFNAIATLMVGYLANLGFPRLGEILRPVALSNYEKIPVEKAAGTVVAERALDMLMLLLFTLLAMFLEFDTLWNYILENQGLVDKIVPILTSPFFFIPVLLVAVLSVFILRGDWIRSTRIWIRVMDMVKGFLDGLISVLKLEQPLVFIAHTLFIWIMYFLMTRVCFYAFEPTAELSLSAGLMVFVFGTLGFVFPSPGGMGSYHALLMAGLALYGVEQSDGFTFANILFFSIQIFCNLFFGLMAYVLLPLYNKNYEGALLTEN